MIKVTVLDSQINERGGSFTNDRNENVEFTTRKQRGKLEADGFAYPFDVRLDKGQPGYQGGGGGENRVIKKKNAPPGP